MAPATRLQLQVRRSIRNLTIFNKLSKTHDVQSCYAKYLESSLDFTAQLEEITLNKGNKTSTQINKEKRLLFLTRFDIPVKPKNLRSRDPEQFYEEAKMIYALIETTINDISKDATFKSFVEQMFEVSVFYALSTEHIPPLSQKISEPFTTKIVCHYNSRRVKVNPFRDCEVPFFMNDISGNALLNPQIPSEWKSWLSCVIYSFVYFHSLPKIAGPLSVLKLNELCVDQVCLNDVQFIIREDIFAPIMMLLMNLGVDDIGLSSGVELQSQVFKELIDVSKISNPRLMCSPIEEMCFHDFTPNSYKLRVVVPIFVCEPGMVKKLIDHFGKCNFDVTRRKSPIQYIICQAVCSLLSNNVRYAIITDYNNFLLLSLSQVEHGTEGSFKVDRGEKGNLSYKVNCEVRDVRCNLDRITLFFIEAVLEFKEARSNVPVLRKKSSKIFFYKAH